MSKSIKIGIAAVVVSILFEMITFGYGLHDNINSSAISFMFHSFALVSSVAITIISISKHKDFNDIISQFKSGIKTTSVYAILMSSFFFSYNKWINPDYMENRRNHLIELTNASKTKEAIEKEINANPEYYESESSEDLIDNQQESINTTREPKVIFALSLFSLMILGMGFSLIIALVNRLFQKRFNL
tara:strand:+ start:972 stop:1535 length:564 start_codon:yes stop_codon:yes gene_type:complete